MSGDLLIRSVRPWPGVPGAPLVDVLCRAGRIARIGADLPPAPGVPEVGGGGGALLPAFVDAHSHAGSADGLARLAAAGTMLARVHVPVDAEARLGPLDAALAARRAHADRLTVQLVAYPARGVLGERSAEDLLDAALDTGADLVGGLDPAGTDRDPVRHLDVVFGLADKHGAGVDLHLRDPGELGAFEIELVCERVAALGMRGRVTLSHCDALGTVDTDRQDRLVDLLAEHDVAVTTVVPGRPADLPLRKLRRAGVRVGLGHGGDPLGGAAELTERNGMRERTLVEMCVDVAGRGGAAALGEHGHGLIEGNAADLVVLPAETVAAAVTERPAATLVVRAGRVLPPPPA
ncbi:amidohydrolase family protein [Gandjariella thermophila]|uniref:Cytosine deaminase n=1 Tax=Gandjariella thermophila TaxID=1931992 RepID=A0A4D4J847_9PSEU|nr:amidohydrolase family protein [Gandjariella thermophila]GDY30137.1 cytosine deaminase [Gandjariella thermophila]